AACIVVALAAMHKTCRALTDSELKSRAPLPVCSSTESASPLRRNPGCRDNRALPWPHGGAGASFARAADAADRNSDRSSADLHYESQRRSGTGRRPPDSEFGDDSE